MKFFRAILRYARTLRYRNVQEQLLIKRYRP